MEAPRQKRLPEDDPAWPPVCQSRRLRGEAKIAWLYLWQKAGGRPATIATTAAAVGVHQGGGERSGLRSLLALEMAGLIEVINRPRRGDQDATWTVFVVDPAEALTSGLRRRTYSGQGEMFEATDGAVADRADCESRVADVVPHPPPSRETFEGKEFKPPSPSKPSTFNPNLRTFDPSKAPEKLNLVARAGELAARQPELPDDDAAMRLAAQFVKAVGGLRIEPALRVARAVCDGRMDLDDIRGIIGSIAKARRAGRIEHGEWCYFVGCCRKRFAALGIPWPQHGASQ